jgi:hypothetical protein
VRRAAPRAHAKRARFRETHPPLLFTSVPSRASVTGSILDTTMRDDILLV